MVPAISPKTTKSPISNGLSMPMESEAKMSLSSVCTARAMAIPPTPRLATMAVMSTPRLARIDSSIMVQTTIRSMMPMMVVVTGLRALPSRVRLSIHRWTAVSSQRAIWKASAMNQPWDMADSQRSGSSANFRPISRDIAMSSSWLVRLSISATMPAKPLGEPLLSLRRRLVTTLRTVCSTR